MEEPGRLQSMGSLRVGHDWVTSLSLSLSCTGEGNGNPLQYSCLENPRDRGDWWAAVHGVAQSRTRLKRLSSSSSAGFLLLPGFSIVGVSRGYSLVTVHRFSIAVASLVAEMGSRCMGFSHYGLWAQLPLSMWNLPGPEIEPMNAASAGRLNHWTIRELPGFHFRIKSQPFKNVLHNLSPPCPHSPLLYLTISFQIVVLKKILESPLGCKEIKPVNLKEINLEYSLEGLMLKLKL